MSWILLPWNQLRCHYMTFSWRSSPQEMECLFSGWVGVVKAVEILVWEREAPQHDNNGGPTYFTSALGHPMTALFWLSSTFLLPVALNLFILLSLFSCSATVVVSLFVLESPPSHQYASWVANDQTSTTPAPEHRAQRIGDLLEPRHMHMDVEEKKQSYEKLCKTLRYDATREDNYRTDALTVF